MLGERLAEVRKDHGDTQKELAKKLKVSVQAVSGWEQDRNEPPQHQLVSICKLYEVSADYLLGLSNVDPAYVQRRRLERFSKEELDFLEQMERYLLWRRANDRREK